MRKECAAQLFVNISSVFFVVSSYMLFKYVRDCFANSRSREERGEISKNVKALFEPS